MGSSDKKNPATPPSLRELKRNCLLLLLGWSVLVGYISGVADSQWELAILIVDSIVLTVLVIKWTIHDADQQGFRLWRYFVLTMIICPGPILVMPIYFVRTRGWGYGMLAFVLFIGFMMFQASVSLSVTYLVLGYNGLYFGVD